MCYSEESSLTSFIIGGTASLYLLFFAKDNTNRHVGLFLFSVCLMQLLEYFMWKDQKCGLMNDIASRSVMLILSLQLYSIFLGAYIYNTSIIPKNILKIILIVLTPIFVYYGSNDYFDKNKKWCTKPNEDNSLQWANHNNPKYLTYIYYLVFLIFPFLLKKMEKGILILLFGIATFMYTRYENTNTSNSRWCYFSSYLPIIFILFEKFKI